MPPLVAKIVSGGQTGVDRAALDVARDLGLACGGWCPRGRLAEDGIISPEYPLQETPSADYSQRTRWNVRDSDGTLVLTMGPLVTPTQPQAAASPAHPESAETDSLPPDAPLSFFTRQPQARQDAPLSENGTAFTIEVAIRLNKPYLVLDLTDRPGVGVVHHWAKAHDVQILNIAGPRESTCPGIYARAKHFLLAVLTEDPDLTP